MKKLSCMLLIIILLVQPLVVFGTEGASGCEGDSCATVIHAWMRKGNKVTPIQYLTDKTIPLGEAVNSVVRDGNINVDALHGVWADIQHMYEAAYVLLLTMDTPNSRAGLAGADFADVQSQVVMIEEQMGTLAQTIDNWLVQISSDTEGNKLLRSMVEEIAEMQNYVSFSGNTENINGLKELLKHRLSTDLINMYGYTWDYIHSTNNEARSREALDLIVNGVNSVQRFNDDWDSAPNNLSSDDLLPLSVPNNFFIGIRAAQVRDLTQLDEAVATEKFNLSLNSQTGKLVGLNAELAHVYVSNAEKLQELIKAHNLGDPADYLKLVTGRDVWQIEEGYNAPTIWGNDSTRFDQNSGQKKVVEEGPALRDVYLALFAASAVYSPFHSKYGDEDYMYAFKHLISNESNYDEVIYAMDLFGEVSQYSKPLYGLIQYSGYSSSLVGHDTQHSQFGLSYVDQAGPIWRLTLGDLMDAVTEGKELRAVTVPGKMQPDGDAWVFLGNNVSSTNNMELTLRTQKIEASAESSISQGVTSRTVFELDAMRADGRTATGYLFDTPTPGTVTSAMLKNILMDQYLKNELEKKRDEVLYLNVVGDIMLRDGTIILPAASNPVYFATPFSNDKQHWWYNPFTVAFWNSYPTIYGSPSYPNVQKEVDIYKYYFSAPSGKVKIANSSNPDSIDIGAASYSMSTQAIENQYNKYSSEFRNPIDWGQGLRTLDRDVSTGFASYTDQLDSTLSTFRVFTLPVVLTENPNWDKLYSTALLWPWFSVRYGSTGASSTTHVFGIEVMQGLLQIGGEEVNEAEIETYPIRLTPISTNGEVQVFPLITGTSGLNSTSSATAGNGTAPTSATHRQTALKLIAENMFLYITNDQNLTSTTAPSGSGMLREAFMFYHVINSILDGMVTPTAYQKTVALEELLLGSTQGTLDNTVIGIANGLVQVGNSMDNFFGIASPDEKSALAPAYGFFHKYWMYMLFFLLLFLLVVFLKTKSFQRVTMIMFVLFIGIYGFLYIAPRLAPIVLGTPLSMVTNQITGNVMLLRGETYTERYQESADDFPMGSIVLYSMSLQDSIDMSSMLQYRPERFMTNRIPLDERMGVYLVGTEIRLDLKKFWSQNSLVSEWISDGTEEADRSLYTSRHIVFPWNREVHAFQIITNWRMSNPEMLNYYTPMLFLQDGFVNTLNTFLREYSVPRSVIQYPNGLVKDTYVVPSFVNSTPFLALLPQVQAEIAKWDYNNREAALIREYFPNPGDILQLQWLVDTHFLDLPASIGNTIWIQAMFENGYYDDVYGKARRQALANAVNDAAYQFLIENSPDIGLVSDENLIKLTALYASLEFNRQISRWGNMVYPRYLSLNEFSVSDILTASVLHSSERFLFYDIELIPNVYYEYGVFGVIAVCVTLCIMIAIAFINGLLVPIMYLGTVLLICLMALFQRNIRNSLLFAFKCFGLIAGVNVLSLIALSFFAVIGGSMKVYVLAVLFLAIFITFIILIMKVIRSTKVLGSERMGTFASAVHQRASKLLSGRPRGGRNYGGYGGYSGYQQGMYMPGVYSNDSFGDHNEYDEDEDDSAPGRRYQ